MAFDRASDRCDSGDFAVGMLWLSRALQLAKDSDDQDLARIARTNLASLRYRLLSLEFNSDEDFNILTVAYGPKGTFVVRGMDGTVELWDASEMVIRHILKGHDSRVSR
jgi:WD40 repeat protein